jgi:hypothetical protein
MGPVAELELGKAMLELCESLKKKKSGIQLVWSGPFNLGQCLQTPSEELLSLNNQVPAWSQNS